MSLGNRPIAARKDWAWYEVSHADWGKGLVYRRDESAVRQTFWSSRDAITVHRTDLSFPAGLKKATAELQA